MKIKRLNNLFLGEARLLFKYEIFYIYIILSVLYLCLLESIPKNARVTTAVILIFSDPAAMGLFFMGAIVLLEKSQRLESSLGVSPIKISEYVIAKVLPLLTLGVFVSLLLCIFGNIQNIFLCMIGVALSSILFSLIGLFVASKIQTLNGFMIATVPFEIITFTPPILFLFGVIKSELWILHPGVAAIKLIMGNSHLCLASILSLCIWNILCFFISKAAVVKSFCKMGGAKI